MELKNAVAVVTGGSQGIGFAIAKSLKEAGCEVVITGRRKDKLARAAEALGAHPINANVANPQDVERTYKEVESVHGRLDILINNAGTGGEFKQLLELEIADFENVFGTNVFGAAMMARGAAQMFVRQNSGNIVNIGSTASLKGFAHGSVYSASKFALRALSQCWQAELRKSNVRVFQVNPSEVVTAFNNSGEDRVEEANKLSGHEIATAVVGALQMDSRGFIPELTVWATNPW